MTARRIFVALLALLAALDVLILAIRVYDTVAIGRLRYLAAEGPVLYSIWKVRNGYPLYEWPLQSPYTLTLYNFLFYHVYAAIFTALRVSNDAMLVVGRLVTVAFVIAGVAAQYAAGRLFVPRSFRVPLALLCVVTLLGNPLPAMWSIAIGPDVPGVAFSAAGIAIAIAALRADRPERLMFAGVAFLLAWTFKQTQIALFSAMCVYVLVWHRSIKAFAFLAAPFVIGVAAALTIGGAEYRANVIGAPTINLLIPYLALFWYRSVALPHLLLWGMSLYAIVALVRPGSVHGPLRSIADVPERSRKVFGADLTYPALAAIAAFATGTVAMMKTGSSVHHLLELNVAASLLCAAVVGSLWETPKARRPRRRRALLLPMIGYDAAAAEHAESALDGSAAQEPGRRAASHDGGGERRARVR